MKRIFFTLAVVALAHGVWAQEQVPDSISMYDEIQKIEVVALRATPSTPVAYANLDEEVIERNNYGLDIPSLLALTPSMIATNETGIGIGGTSIRLRGTDGALNFTPCFLLALTSLPTLKVFVRVTMGIGEVIHIWNASALVVSWGFTSVFIQQN